MKSILAAPLLVVLLASGTFAACGGGAGDQAATPGAHLTAGQATRTAEDYARMTGLLGTETPAGTSAVQLTVRQARQLVAPGASPDPFPAISPTLSDNDLVWVVTFVQPTQPTPGGDLSVTSEEVIVLVDDVSGRALWSEQTRGTYP
jgi:hypothetical protein